MVAEDPETFSAGASALGYLYQPRFALYHLLGQDERCHVFIEKQDDLDFEEKDGKLTLGSLKHKKPGETLSDLATDFWKSVRVWLASYKQLKDVKELRFFLFTTAKAKGQFSKLFLADAAPLAEDETWTKKADEVIARSKGDAVMKASASLAELTEKEKEDFFSRITIFDCSPRIEDLPALIQNRYMRPVPTQARKAVFQRLEGWWNDEIILLLSGRRTEPIVGAELSDKLSAIADEYKLDNLPITFSDSKPGTIDASTDPRLFVAQLREIGISTDRIKHAIIDYYRAFEQRSAWARENLLKAGEIEKYEDRLTEEWERYRAVIFDRLDTAATERTLQEKGDDLYRWAQMGCMHVRIRQRVEEAYVVRGNFQILANENPPRVFWHPLFLDRLEKILGGLQ